MNLMLLESPPEDWLGQGKTYRTTDPFAIQLRGNRAGFMVFAAGFSFQFAPPPNGELSVGSYTGAARPGSRDAGGGVKTV